MHDYLNRLHEAKNFLDSKLGDAPKIGVVLGSGLGNFAESFENQQICEYSEIPHFHQTTVVGHKGRLILGECEGVKVVAMQGRFHPYEGHDIHDVVFPIRLLALWGIKDLFLSNASGGINTSYKPGDLVLVKDHINMMGRNPLMGPNMDELGVRFPDMGQAYNPELGKLIKKSATELDIKLLEGIYCSVLGPSYETPAEIRMMRTLGADLVGMSTVPEVIAAHHMGVRVATVSCVTNHAAGVVEETLNHEDVKDVANSVMKKFSSLLRNTIGMMK